MRRLLAVLFLGLALSPGLLWRMAPPPPDYSQSLSLLALAVPEAAARIGGAAGPRVTGAWQLVSPNSNFGSYSALVPTGGGEMLAISDRGQFLRFALPGTPPRPAVLSPVFSVLSPRKPSLDMESVTRDPSSGQLWIGFESTNAIIRFAPDLTHPVETRPPQMRRWAMNGGPEAMVRLADGRFLVLGESRSQWRGQTGPGLLFAGDPVAGGTPLEFRFAPPDGYYPSDVAQLPDGRVVVVLRGVQVLPPRFRVKLVLADPAAIRPGALWPWREIGEIAPPLPLDNYEGLAITGGSDGGPVTMWLISDDNGAKFVERTLLLRLEWQVPPRAAPAAP